MSWVNEYRTERRADRVAEREQARLDADATAARAVEQARVLAEQDRADRTAKLKATSDRREARRVRRAATRVRVARWLSAHRVRLPIYLLAVVSAVMAVPAMAGYGITTYGNPTGAALPALSELGMWAFALAVEVSRHRHPDRPVWALQVGTWVFAAVGAGLNLVHGLDLRGIDAGVVMGIVSVAGVVAHQIAVAAPPRSATERADARIERHVLRKVAKVRAAAVKEAVAEIDPAGVVTLSVAPGRYVLERGRLVAAIEPPRPPADVLADEVSAWLATLDPAPGADADRPNAAGPVATLDPPADPSPEQRKSTPKPRTHRAPKRRTIDQLRVEFAAALADPTVPLNPKSAESIRTTLECAPKFARQLRDEHKSNHQ